MLPIVDSSNIDLTDYRIRLFPLGVAHVIVSYMPVGIWVCKETRPKALLMLQRLEFEADLPENILQGQIVESSFLYKQSLGFFGISQRGQHPSYYLCIRSNEWQLRRPEYLQVPVHNSGRISLQTLRSKVQIIAEKFPLDEYDKFRSLKFDIFTDCKLRKNYCKFYTGDIKFVEAEYLVRRYNQLTNKERIDSTLKHIAKKNRRRRLFYEEAFLLYEIIVTSAVIDNKDLNETHIDKYTESLLITLDFEDINKTREMINELVLNIKKEVKRLTGAMDDPNDSYRLIMTVSPKYYLMMDL